MKTLITRFILPALLLIDGCAPTTYVTGTWKNPSAQNSYHQVLVAALTSNTVLRSKLETEMAKALQNKGLQGIKGIDLFPPNLANDSLSRQQLHAAVQKSGCEAILTISLQKKETETRYTGGTYAPARYPYYNTLWGYYDYWYPYGFSPGYYTKEDVYYFETNLYDGKSEALTWSAQSASYGMEGLTDISDKFGATVVQSMCSAGVLR